MPSTSKLNLIKMFDRPREFSFMPKGDGEKPTVFELPPEYVVPEYNYINFDLQSRFGDDASEVVSVGKIQIPQLGDITEIPRDENFSVYIPKHRRIAAHLIDIFLGVPNVDDLLSMAVYIRDRVNPYLFNYCFSIALLHRKDTQDVDIPSSIRSFPDKFIDSKVFAKAREMATVVPEGSRKPIEIPKDFTASDLEVEHRLFYFREDLGVNLHYYHWHLVHPTDGAPRIVNKDRRGELFCYMHHQILARYNFERLCNNLSRVKRFHNLDEAIEEGYFSKLDSLVASRSWPPRLANQKLGNLRRESEGISMDVQQLKTWRDRIYQAISSGVVMNAKGERIPLSEAEGINILGNMVESNLMSVNREYYGDLNNMGHVFISFVHDPEEKHLESFSVMGDIATAMRDPAFYKWYAYIDTLFEDYKATLPRYTVKQLNFPGVVIENCSVESGGPQNVLNTFWQQSDIDLSKGMDFQPRGAVYIRFTHLNHAEFKYKITINNQTGGNREGTIRIFLSPKYNEAGKTWTFRDQKNMFIELDKFRVTLREGRTVITRASTQSSVTIPFNNTFHDLDTGSSKGSSRFNFCGCGWPHHMLLPKGQLGGLDCELFVMISDFNGDRVEQDTLGVCSDAESYCGIKDRHYPDRRPMGYPFDRQPRSGVSTLKEFLTPNMKVADCKIIFTDQTVKPSKSN